MLIANGATDGLLSQCFVNALGMVRILPTPLKRTTYTVVRFFVSAPAPDMAVRLFHFTSRSRACDIITRGFDGETCWLSPTLHTVCGEAARSGLLAVELEVTVAELEPFMRTVTEDEVWDDTLGDFVFDPDSAVRYVWYEVPTALIAAKGRIRLVSADERAGLWSGGE